MIRILIVDDQKTIRESIKVLLEKVPEFTVIGTANNGLEAIVQVAKLNPDVVLIDVEMPELDGLKATEIISQSHEKVKILILTIHDRVDLIAQALSLGAAGYLLKNMSSQQIIKAIRFAFQGYTEIKPSIDAKANPKNFVSNETVAKVSLLESKKPTATNLESTNPTATNIVQRKATNSETLVTTTAIPNQSSIFSKNLVVLGGLVVLGLLAVAISISSRFKSNISAETPLITTEKKQTPETVNAAEANPSSKVIALGKLLPEGGVIKISVVNAQDSRVEKILVQEGDFVEVN